MERDESNTGLQSVSDIGRQGLGNESQEDTTGNQDRQHKRARRHITTPAIKSPQPWVCELLPELRCEDYGKYPVTVEEVRKLEKACDIAEQFIEDVGNSPLFSIKGLIAKGPYLRIEKGNAHIHSWRYPKGERQTSFIMKRDRAQQRRHYGSPLFDAILHLRSPFSRNSRGQKLPYSRRLLQAEREKLLRKIIEEAGLHAWILRYGAKDTRICLCCGELREVRYYIYSNSLKQKYVAQCYGTSVSLQGPSSMKLQHLDFLRRSGLLVRNHVLLNKVEVEAENA